MEAMLLGPKEIAADAEKKAMKNPPYNKAMNQTPLMLSGASRLSGRRRWLSLRYMAKWEFAVVQDAIESQLLSAE